MNNKGSEYSRGNGVQTSRSTSYDGSKSKALNQSNTNPQTFSKPVASASKQSISSQQSNSINTSGSNNTTPSTNPQTFSKPVASASKPFNSSQQSNIINTSDTNTTPSTNTSYTVANKVQTITNQAIVLSNITNMTQTAKETLNTYNNRKISNSEFLNSGRSIVGKIDNSLRNSDDLGAQTISGAYAGVRMSATAFKTSQAIVSATPQIAKTGANGVAVVGKGVYQVGLQAGLTTVAVTQAYNIAKGLQVMPMSSDAMRILKTTAVTSGLSQTAISQSVIQTATSIQSGITHSISAVKSIVPNTILLGQRLKDGGIATANVTVNTVKLAYATTRGIAEGTLKVSFVAYQLECIAKHKLGTALIKSMPRIKTGFYSTVRGTAVGTKWFALKGLPKGIKTLRGGISTLAGMGDTVDDYAIQGVINTIKGIDVASRLGGKTIKTGYSLGKNVTRTGIKTGKGVYKAGKGIHHASIYWKNFVKANGVRRMLAEAGHKTGLGVAKLLANAGKSVVTALLNLVKAVAGKFLIPLLLIIFLVCGGLSVLSAPITAVGSIFSGTFGTSDTDEEFEVQAFLSDPNFGVPTYTLATKLELVEKIFRDWKVNGGICDVVRLKNPDGTGEIVEPTADGIESVFYKDIEVVQILEPIFNAVILMDYDLEPTLDEAKDLLSEMYEELFTITTIQTTEFCGQDLLTGEGDVIPCDSCGNIHALDDCPHFIQGHHTSFTCDECCEYYYICNGYQGGLRCGKSEHSHSGSCYSIVNFLPKLTCGKEEHSHSPWRSASNSGCYYTNRCSGGGEMASPCTHSSQYFRCNGYKYCDGHEVNTYEISLDGLYPLIYKYFLEPIDTLSNKVNRTEEENEKLANLKDYYEIFQIMMTEVSGGTYGGGLTVDDLRGVQWETSSRRGNADVINLATSQATQSSVGGALYWSYYGFNSRVEWCACFVHWCMRNTSSATASYPTSSNNAYCQTVANNFSTLGQFKSKSEYENITRGDVIFFDWQCDGHTDHVGLVIGRDDEFVYTVEGNSGDAVKIRKYDLNSSVIYGYAFINY